MQARHTHIRSYRLKLRYLGREGTPIYVVTVESPRLGQARHSHLRSCSENLKNVYVYYTYVVMPVVNVCISVRESQYHLPVLETFQYISAFCALVAVRGTPSFSLVTSFAIWWPSLELEIGSVTFVSDELTQLKLSVRYIVYIRESHVS